MTSSFPITQPRSISQVRDLLKELEHQMCKSGDANAYFTALYRVTTNRCKLLCNAIENFDHPCHGKYQHLDGRLIRDIVVYFGPRYFIKHSSYYAGTLSDNDPWHDVLQHGVEGSPASVLILGAYTHIAFDLPIVLARSIINDAPLFDPSDPKQRHTLDQLNWLFMEDLSRIVYRVASVERRLQKVGSRNIGGSLHILFSPYLRSASPWIWRHFLKQFRDSARINASLLRYRRLDEKTLAANVTRKTRLLIRYWKALGRSRQNGAPHAPQPIHTSSDLRRFDL